MDRVQDSSPVVVVGVDAIDRISVSAIARALGISKQAVRKLLRSGRIPDDRQGDIRRLLETLPEQVSAVAWVAEVFVLDRWVPPAQQSAIGLFDWHGDCRTTQTSREASDIGRRFYGRFQKDVLTWLT